MNPMISPFFQSPTVAGISQRGPGFSGSGTQPGRQVAERTRKATPLLRGTTDRRGGRRGLWEKWGGSWWNQRKMPWVQILICVQNPKSQNESGDFNILASRPGGLSGDGEAEENGEEHIKKHGNFTDKQVQNKNYSKLDSTAFWQIFPQSHGVPLILCPAGIQHARGRLLDALRQRGKAGRRDSKLRLGEAGESVMKWVYSTVYSIHVALW